MAILTKAEKRRAFEEMANAMGPLPTSIMASGEAPTALLETADAMIRVFTGEKAQRRRNNVAEKLSLLQNADETTSASTSRSVRHG